MHTCKRCLLIAFLALLFYSAIFDELFFVFLYRKITVLFIRELIVSIHPLDSQGNCAKSNRPYYANQKVHVSFMNVSPTIKRDRTVLPKTPQTPGSSLFDGKSLTHFLL